MADLATVLVEGRHRRNWSQEELAFHSDVSLSTVARAEQGKAVPNRNSLRRLAAAIGENAEELISLARRGTLAQSLAELAGRAARPLIPPRMTRVPHFGGVSAVRTDQRDEISGEFSDLPDVGVDFTVSVDGQCMEPRYENGERVGCSIGRWLCEGFVWNKDYWIRFKDGQTTLKRVKPDPRHRDKIICFPVNPKAKSFSRFKADVEKAARVLVTLLK